MCVVHVRQRSRPCVVRLFLMCGNAGRASCLNVVYKSTTLSSLGPSGDFIHLSCRGLAIVCMHERAFCIVRAALLPRKAAYADRLQRAPIDDLV